MRYQNPVISGFYPDPSICKANDKYYLVCSSFQYFPGVPLFESKDLVSWKQIGHVLTRESQLDLKKADGASGGIYAPTIRYNNGRFYMITTNVTSKGNFYVWTDNIYGEWSEPIWLLQGGIDPSLYFEDEKAYLMSNGQDDEGVEGISQCEIDINTGIKLTKSKCIYKGAGGRYLESPHLYKIKDEYYIMAAEGGTEYGHMVIYAKGKTPFGPFENAPNNPVLTNRNLGGYLIQGCGHGDLIEDHDGNWWMVHLAFRQIDRWLPFHLTGREVYLVPVKFDENGWFNAGINGVTPKEIEVNYIEKEVDQQINGEITFDNSVIGREWCFLRNPNMELYKFSKVTFYLTGTEVTLDSVVGSPAFVAVRQKELVGNITCEVTVYGNEAGITLYMDSEHHYDLSLRKMESKNEIVKRSCVGGLNYEQKVIELDESKEPLTVQLRIALSNLEYNFFARVGDTEYDLGALKTRYISTEVACGFTGVMIGLYAQGEDFKMPAEFKGFVYEY